MTEIEGLQKELKKERQKVAFLKERFWFYARDGSYAANDRGTIPVIYDNGDSARGTLAEVERLPDDWGKKQESGMPVMTSSGRAIFQDRAGEEVEEKE